MQGAYVTCLMSTFTALNALPTINGSFAGLRALEGSKCASSYLSGFFYL